MTSSQVKVNASTELYGIFGNPVRHSLSPLIHNTLFQQFKLNAVYLAFQVEKEQLSLAFEAVRSLGIRGVSVTIPHKESATNFMDEIPEDLDRCVGAINTVVNKHGKLYGYNTDNPGFLSALKDELGFDPEGKSVLVLGAGGAARGVVSALAHAEADRIMIHNRTHERARGLKDYMSGYFPDTEIDSLDSLEAVRGEKIDLVVNTTSVGMGSADPSPLNLDLLAKPAVVYDLVYSSPRTCFLEQAKGLGWPFANGLGMLAAQAALSFELWTGRGEGVREAMLEILRKCHF